MNTYTNVKDLGDLHQAVQEALQVKQDRFAYKSLGENKTLLSWCSSTPACAPG